MCCCAVLISPLTLPLPEAHPFTQCCCVQGVLNWVADPAPGRSPPRVELRLYDVLFRYWARILNPAFNTSHPHVHDVTFTCVSV